MQIFNEIEQSFFQLHGQPTFGIKTENVDASFQIQLWFYSPPSNLSADNTVIYTVGLSQRYFESPCPWIELSFQVPGQYKRPQLEKLGMILGELIYDTCKVTHFTPNLLLTGLKHYFMPDMKEILVVEGAGIRPLWLEMEDKTVRMLQLIPVYNEELPLICEMGFWNTYRTFIENKINFLAPNRTRIKESRFHPDDQRLARKVEIYNAEPSKDKIWQDIQKWYQVNAPGIQAAQLEKQPSPSDNWEVIFGLNNLYTDKFTVAKTDEWLENHWQRLYAGCVLPTQERFLSINPHFFPN